MKNNTNCTFCKKEIYKRPSQFVLYKKHFCNNLCQKEYEKSVNTKTTINCSECDKEIIRTRRQLRNAKSGNCFCNNLCKNRFLVKDRWKDNKSTKDHQHKRKNVLEKSNNACVNCGYDKDARMLDIHHIDGNHQNNDISNLCGVCVWCHHLYHRCKIELTNEVSMIECIHD